MTFPAVTAAYAAILGLIYFALSAWVVMGRAKFRVINGDGGVSGLHRRIRAHANFAEYVPLILLLAALIEAGGGSRTSIHALLLPLTIARLMHPVGMVAKENSRQQYMFRAPGAIVTWAVLIAASVMLLLRVV
jgi:uncharacterized membrane protein YecN with MAPEG domain